jgi:hypothetical protein
MFFSPLLQVLDDDFIAMTECFHDSDCFGCNERFLDKCGRYDCGSMQEGPFKCDQERDIALMIRDGVSRNTQSDKINVEGQRIYYEQSTFNGLVVKANQFLT